MGGQDIQHYIHNLRCHQHHGTGRWRFYSRQGIQPGTIARERSCHLGKAVIQLLSLPLTDVPLPLPLKWIILLACRYHLSVGLHVSFPCSLDTLLHAPVERLQSLTEKDGLGYDLCIPLHHFTRHIPDCRASRRLERVRAFH
jgi:hypothetical protein